MALEYPNRKMGAGSVAANGSEVWGRGATPASVSTGVVTLTLGGGGLDATECSIAITIRGTTAGYVTVDQTSDTVKTVHLFDTTGNAANLAFDYEIVQAPAS